MNLYIIIEGTVHNLDNHQSSSDFGCDWYSIEGALVIDGGSGYEVLSAADLGELAVNIAYWTDTTPDAIEESEAWDHMTRTIRHVGAVLAVAPDEDLALQLASAYDRGEIQPGNTLCDNYGHVMALHISQHRSKLA